MRIPLPFSWAINALNEEREFCAEDIPVTATSEGYVKPYWAELRDDAYRLGQTIALGAFKERPRGPLPPEKLPYALPSEWTYRKAQAEYVRVLRDLIEKWRSADWNMTALFEKDPHVRKLIEQFIRRRPLVLVPASAGPSLLINPFSPVATFGLQRVPKKRDRPVARARRDALTMFIRLMQHPAHPRIGRCVRCNRYFFGRAGQKCCPRPRRCGSHVAALRATKENWSKKRKELIAQAQEAVKRWELDGVRTPWKTWVARRVRKTEKWVTLAVNRDELNPPRIVDESSCGRSPSKKGKHDANADPAFARQKVC